MIVLLDTTEIAYEGAYTVLVGVFSTQELAEEAAIEWAEREKAEAMPYRAEEYLVPSPENNWSFWKRGMDYRSFQFIETELDKLYV